MTQQAAVPLHPIADGAEAREVIGHLGGVIEALAAMLDHETALVRAGKLAEVARMEAAKTNLARKYVADTLRLKGAPANLSEEIATLLAPLRPRHERFHSLVQTNLTVLATAHAVSESIIRGVAEEVTRKTAPQTYGASGRTGAHDPRHARPLAISRRL